MLDLSVLAPGFHDPGLESQVVFRQCLDALAHPGTIIQLARNLTVPEPMMPATGAIAMALLDQDTSVWLSPGLAIAPVVDYLRFHTGCRLETDCGAADFALVHSAHELPELAVFNQGSDEFPERSTAVVVQMARLGNDAMWELSGPGIEHRRSLSVAPGRREGSLGNTAIEGSDFARSFASHWKQNHLRFPCGIDLFFASGHQLCALPRSTRLSV